MTAKTAPVTLALQLELTADLRRLEADHEEADICTEAAAELRRLQSEVERLSNNRDMWKSQCERQAAELAQLRAIRAEAKGE